MVPTPTAPATLTDDLAAQVYNTVDQDHKHGAATAIDGGKRRGGIFAHEMVTTKGEDPFAKPPARPAHVR